MKKIVCFGGGNAVPNLLLPELKRRNLDITTVTSMVDSGGSSGQLRQDFGILPPGDIRRHMVALSGAPAWKKELFSLRFGHDAFEGGHRGHTFGNIFIGGLEYVLKDYEKALKIAHEFLEVKGMCLPATTQKAALAARLENGDEIIGEDEIDIPKRHNAHLKISEIYLKPEVRAYPPVLGAIKKADIITIGPGDIYSSILPCFLPKGIKEAMQKSKAKKVFICPAMTKIGETQHFSVSDIAEAAEKYTGMLNHVIFNTDVADRKRLEDYRKEDPVLVEQLKFSGTGNKKFIGKKLLIKKGPIVYEPKKVVDALMDLG